MHRLCSISELLVNLKQTTIFLNAREIEGDILDFVFDELGISDLYKKHKEIYLHLVNLLLTVQNKLLFIIVDAINENDSDGFGNRISTFINKISDYSRVKIVVSCRNEYYKERFRKYLVEKVNIPAFEFDLKEQRYGISFNGRMISNYKQQVRELLFKVLNRRSDRKSYTREGFIEMLKYYPLAMPKIYVSLF